jgi:serine/threonine protein kinase
VEIYATFRSQMPITALREIRILKSLNHPNIVPVIDIAYEEGVLVMFCLQGSTGLILRRSRRFRYTEARRDVYGFPLHVP